MHVMQRNMHEGCASHSSCSVITCVSAVLPAGQASLKSTLYVQRYCCLCSGLLVLSLLCVIFCFAFFQHATVVYGDVKGLSWLHTLHPVIAMPKMPAWLVPQVQDVVSTPCTFCLGSTYCLPGSLPAEPLASQM